MKFFVLIDEHKTKQIVNYVTDQISDNKKMESTLCKFQFFAYTSFYGHTLYIIRYIYTREEMTRKACTETINVSSASLRRF